MSSKAARRYAKALFDLAEEKKALKIIHGSIAGISQLLEESKEFAAFIKNPVINPEKQREVLEHIFKKKIDRCTYTFILFLVEQKKLILLSAVCEEFEEFYLERVKIAKARLVSAVKLSQSQINAISEKLKKYYQKDIELDVEVDKNMLGGFRVQVGDRIYDMSVRAQLAKYRKAVMRA